MSQFGMQMPGGRGRRGLSPDVYTGLLFLSVVLIAWIFIKVFKTDLSQVRGDE